ncbi:zinc finger protein 90-like [Ctenocephalides felis]|uniref:zinc finger protein 90-like n=1 Tax=Ctenocephalides felis TaxID=7515 RepID=UPI000E6E5B3B|nr:zinc finger protein 90-like [Ctenocephalides felis]
MSEEKTTSIKIEPLEYSAEDPQNEEDIKSESCSENGETCLERFMNSKITVEEEIKQELMQAPINPFVCTICDNAFALRHHLDRHIIAHNRELPIHAGELLLKCKICNRDFHSSKENSQFILENLLANAIYVTETFAHQKKCGICNKSLAQSDALNAHKFINSREFPYQCETCSKSLHASKTLNNHKAQNIKYMRRDTWVLM